jgi:hypothetical protein
MKFPSVVIQRLNGFDFVNKVPTTAGLSVLLSPELDNLIELNLKEKERLRLEAEAAEQAEPEEN